MKSSLIVLATALCAAGLLTSSANATSNQSTPKKSPQNYTCEDLLTTDFEYVPEIVYWHDGWNEKQKDLKETIVEDWYPIAVDEVWTECSKAPHKKVAEVVHHQRAKHEQKPTG